MKKEALKQIKECKELFDKHRVQEQYNENNAWYYLGVFDVLFGLYHGNGDPDESLAPKENESLTDNLDRCLTKFLEDVG